MPNSKSTAKGAQPARWGLKVELSGQTRVTREAVEDEWDADDLSHDMGLQSMSPCGQDELPDLVVAFEPLEGMGVYAVAVTYGTGDSFHREEGLMMVVAAFSDEAFANRAAACIQASSKARSLCVFEQDGTLLRINSEWSGYFESLESVRVHRMSLGPMPKPPAVKTQKIKQS